MTSSRPPAPRAARRPGTSDGDGPGVPEAIPRTLQGTVDRLGAASIDRIWIFPPRVKGRRESGLIVVSRYPEGGERERRAIITAAYLAERTGRGLTVDWTLSEEGSAPPDRLPPLVEGVVRRAGDDAPAPSEVEVRGDPGALRRWFSDHDEAHLDPTLWPSGADTTEHPPALGGEASHPEQPEPAEEAEPA